MSLNSANTSLVSSTSDIGQRFTLEQLKTIAKRYAPIIKLHPKEEHFMCSVEWFLQHSTLNGPNFQKASPTVDDLPITGGGDGAWYLEMQDTAKPGNLAQAKTYVSVIGGLSSLYTDIQYWFLYAYNGPGTLHVKNLLDFVDADVAPLGEHWADWESVIVRVDNSTQKPIGLGLAQHGDFKWFKDLRQFSRLREQFLIYSSKNGHASYPSTGTNPTESHQYGLISYFLRNDTQDGGQIFDCSTNLEFISVDYLKSFNAARWLSYPYRWGKGTKSYLPFGEVELLLFRILLPYASLLSPFLLTPAVAPLAAAIGSAVIHNISLDNTEGVVGPNVNNSLPLGTPDFNESMGVICVEGSSTPGSRRSRPYAFMLGSDGKLWRNSWDDSNWNWIDQSAPPHVLLTHAMGALIVNDSKESRPYIFSLGTDAHLWCNWFDGVHWHWSDHGVPKDVPLGSAMGAVTVDKGRPYIFALGNDGNLWCNWWDGGRWNWRNHGLPPNVYVTSAVGALTVVDGRGSRPYVFVRGSDGNLWLNWWDGSNWFWSNQSVPHNVTLGAAIGVVTVDESRPYAFVLGNDGNLWCNWWDGRHMNWGNQGVPTGVVVNRSVGVLTVSDGRGCRPYVFVLGNDGNLWCNWWDGDNWHWNNHGVPPEANINEPIGVTTADGTRPYVYVRGDDRHLWCNWWDGSNWNWTCHV